MWNNGSLLYTPKKSHLVYKFLCIISIEIFLRYILLVFVLYNGYWRVLKHREMVSEGLVDPAKLPTTERAAYYHGQRVHLQVITWKMRDDSLNLQPANWGWRIEENCLVPVPTDKDVAPSNLLKIVRCKCKTSTKN